MIRLAQFRKMKQMLVNKQLLCNYLMFSKALPPDMRSLTVDFNVSVVSVFSYKV